jgi:hypothetical protein
MPRRGSARSAGIECIAGAQVEDDIGRTTEAWDGARRARTTVLWRWTWSMFLQPLHHTYTI